MMIHGIIRAAYLVTRDHPARFDAALYAAPMEDTVVVKVVSDEPEAQIVCGLLSSYGIECGYRDTEKIESSLEDFTASGPREIFVRPSDARSRTSAARRRGDLSRPTPAATGL